MQDETILELDNNGLSPEAAKSYIIELLEELMVMSQSSNLTHLATGLNDLLEPYRD